MNLHLIQKRLLASKKAGIVTNGLVLNLDAGNPLSYPGTGTLWTDLSGNGNNGTLVNGPTFNTANGGSIVFDGVNDYVGVPIPSYLTNQATVNLWIYAVKTEPQLINYVFSMNNFSIWIGGTFSDPSVSSRSIGLNLNSPSLFSSSVANSFTTIDLNKWINICITYDSINRLSIYKNSILLNMFSNNATGRINTQSNLNIGRRNDNNWYWNGRISNNQLYNRALSASEVLQNYNATKSRFGL